MSVSSPPRAGVAMLVSPAIGQLLFRQFYYGTMVPSTVIAKVRVASAALDMGLGWLGTVVVLEPLTAAVLVGTVALFVLASMLFRAALAV